MNQIAQQGKDMLEIIEKYEVPYEYHNALWAAYEAGAEMGFWKAATKVTDLESYGSKPTRTHTKSAQSNPAGISKEGDDHD